MSEIAGKAFLYTELFFALLLVIGAIVWVAGIDFSSDSPGEVSHGAITLLISAIIPFFFGIGGIVVFFLILGILLLLAVYSWASQKQRPSL